MNKAFTKESDHDDDGHEIEEPAEAAEHARLDSVKNYITPSGCHFAEAGGKDPSKIGELLAASRTVLEKMLAT